MGTITVETHAGIEAVDITDLVVDAIAAGGSVALISIPHTSAAIVIGPGDKGMLADFVAMASGLLRDLRPFQHLQENNANGEAHLLSAMIGSSVLLPIDDGSLALGRWQRLLLLEFDGPATRTIQIRAIG
jgi:secondary thiamine-phosphate synthase enzyme